MIKGQKKRTDDAKVKIKGQLPLHHLVLFIWPLYHLSFSFDLCTIRPFLLTLVSSGPFFGLCIICTFLLAFVSSGPFLLAFVSSVLLFWPLHHLSFSFGLCIIWSFSFGLCIICPFLLAFVSSVLFFWPLHHLSFS
jgi:hypothetical protein